MTQRQKSRVDSDVDCLFGIIAVYVELASLVYRCEYWRHMKSQQKLCPKCITLYPGEEKLCPICAVTLIEVAPTTASPVTSVGDQTQSHTRDSEVMRPVLMESTSMPTQKPITYSCPFCEGNILNESAIICPNCNRTLPQNWLDWTNSHRNKLQPPTPSNTPVVGSMPSGDPRRTSQTSFGTGVPSRLVDYSASIVSPSINTFDFYIKIIRGFAYLTAVGTIISMCVVLASLVSLSSRDSSWLSGIGLGAFPALITGLILTFALLLAVDVLQMQKANTENTVFLAKRANETEMVQKQMLVALESISQQLAKMKQLE
jgi:RNA polymerase subunit RPABC4/transcription elongation factor Spt4